MIDLLRQRNGGQRSEPQQKIRMVAVIGRYADYPTGLQEGQDAEAYSHQRVQVNL